MAFTIPNNDVAFATTQSMWMEADITALTASVVGDGVLSGCTVTAQGTPNMTLAVAAGEIQIAGATVTVAAGNVTITTANATNPRIDLVVVSSAGVKSVTAGTAAANPKAPDVPASSILLAMIYVPVNDTAIQTNQITDKRLFVPYRTAFRTAADNTGATDATAQLQADLTTALTLGHRHLTLPAGTFDLRGAGGTVFASLSNVEISGAGVGKTILRVPAATTLTADFYVFRAAGNRVKIHDLSIDGGAGTSGAFNEYLVSATAGAYYPEFRNIECYNVYGNGTAGGSGFDLYQPYNQAEVSTTLGTTFGSAGAQTVTPPSMLGIYAGRTLVIGGTTETIQVTSATATTFTATFANAHNAADTVVGTSNGHQYARLDNCIVRDSYAASGFVINSAANTLTNCRVIRVGSNSTQHGFYVQAGQNVFEHCFVEGVSGYSYHQHIATTTTDASGNRYSNCVSINPGTQHLIADNATSNGTNPNVPNAEQLARYTQVIGCLFARTKGAAVCAGVRIDYGGIVQGCTFEDATGTSGNAWIFSTSSGNASMIVQGNVLRVLNATNNLGIVVNANSIVTGNEIINWNNGSAIRADGKCRIANNQLQLTGGTGIMINASDVTVNDNLLTISGSTTTGIGINNPSLSGIEVKHNTLFCSSSAKAIDFQAASFMPTNSSFVDNRWTGGQCNYYDAPATLSWRNNTGPMNFRGNATALVLDSAAGQLRAFAKGTNVLTSGLLVKIASGLLATLTTSDTIFFGVATSTTDATSASALIAGQVGAEVAGVAVDGAWVAGNIGIASTTVAGKLHDTGGATAPASGSYVVFLDAGGAAGAARVLMTQSVQSPPTTADRAYNVLTYGADYTGVANSTTAFSNAHDAAVAGGGYVWIPPGTYLVDALSKTTAPKWYGAGKDLVTLTMGTVSGAGPWLSFAGAIGSSVALASDAARNSITIVLVSNLTLVEGDLIIIGQDTPYTTDTNRATEYMGQQVEVLSYVSGTFTITLKEPLNETFTTAASAQVKKVTPINGCVLSGFTLTNPSPLTGTAIQCRLKWARDVAVDIRSTYSDSKCLELFSCYRGRVRMDARYAADDLAASRYGYGVSAYVATAHFLIDVLAHKVRHGFTTDSLAGDYGGPNNIVVRGLGVACTNEPFDCHHGGRAITFLGCSAMGCMGYGFQLRCASAQIIGGQVQNCAGGVRIGWRASMDAVVRGVSVHHAHRNTAGNGYSTSDGGNAIRIENNWAAAADTATGMVIENCDFEDIGCDIVSLRSGTTHNPFSFRGNRIKNFGMLAVGGERAVIRPLNTVSGMRFSDNTIETSASSCALFYGNTFWGTDNYAWNNNVGANIARFQAGVEDYVNYWGELTDGTPAGRTYIATFSATPVIDARRGETWQMTLTANVTSSSITNGIAGQKLRLVFVEDATGSRTVVWPTNVINPPTVRSAANAVTVADLWFNGTNWYPADVLASGSGAPTTATYITQTADAGLSAEQALSSLASGYMKVATTTGVVSSQAAPIPLADGGTNATTAAAARASLVAAPAAATYIVQTADSELSAEQVLGSLATGLVKVATSTGVLSTATPDTDYAINYTPTLADHGLLAWTYDFLMATVTLILTGGVLHLMKVVIPRDITVTNIFADISTAGATLTSGQCLAGIYDNTGAKLRETGDQSGAWVSTGLKTMALTSTLAIVKATTPWVYVALLSNGTTQPTFRRAVTSLALANVGLTAGGGYRFGTILTGQTSLPASITIASIAANSNTFFAALG